MSHVKMYLKQRLHCIIFSYNTWILYQKKFNALRKVRNEV